MASIRVFAPDGSWRDVPLDRDVLTLGRDPDNAVVLQGQATSRHHARLQKTPSGWVLEDLGSAHGTFLRGGRVALQTLQTGDAAQLGDSRIEFHDDLADATESAAFLAPASAAPPLPGPAPLQMQPPAGQAPSPARIGLGLKLALLAGALLLLMGAAGVVGFLAYTRLREPRPQEQPPDAAQAPSPMDGARPPGDPAAPPPSGTPPGHAGESFDLVLSGLVLAKTPQVGSMRACILAECGSRRATFHEAREYRHSDGVRLPLDIRLQDVNPTDPVKIHVRLDDDEDRVCRRDAEDQTVIRFPADREGTLTFSPTGRWIIKVHSRLERRGLPG